MIQQAMLDMENMFQLLGQHPALQARAPAGIHFAEGDGSSLEAACRGDRLLWAGKTGAGPLGRCKTKAGAVGLARPGVVGPEAEGDVGDVGVCFSGVAGCKKMIRSD